MDKLICRSMTDRDKREICSWHYDGEYGIYDLPSYEKMKERKMGFMNPEKESNFRVFLDGDTLVGFVNIAEEEKKVFIGIGAAPELCGRGYGRKMLMETYRISQKLYPDKPLYLEVRSWNVRAVKCYEKAGFRIEGEAFEQETHAGMGTFYRMVRK